MRTRSLIRPLDERPVKIRAWNDPVSRESNDNQKFGEFQTRFLIGCWTCPNSAVLGWEREAAMRLDPVLESHFAGS